MNGTEPEAAAAHPPGGPSLWIRELPFVALLVLIMIGVAYTSVAKQPLIVYWELLAPLIGVACVAAGWRSAGAVAARSRLMLTQSLHWAAFLVVMNLLLLPSVQRNLHRQLDRPRRLHPADARRLQRRRAGPLANLSARADHGAGDSDNRLD